MLYADWFNESPLSQQAAERYFLESVPTNLCATPGQTDDEYTSILHAKLETVRHAQNLHVHSAFFVKAACTKINLCYNGSSLFKEYISTYEGGSADCVDFTTVREGTAYSLTCLGAVAEHEKYNLAEGNYFLNMSYYMLERGAAFCTDPNLNLTLATMSVRCATAVG